MSHVIRRMFFLLLCTLALAGCGAAQGRDALSVGDRTISEDGLTDLVIAVNGGSPDGEIPAALSAEVYRQIGRTWLNDAASASYLSDKGVTITQAERESIKTQIEDAIVAQQLAPISRESEGYEALTNNIWVSSQRPSLLEPDTQETIVDMIRDADVGSRIGVIEFDALDPFRFDIVVAS